MKQRKKAVQIFVKVDGMKTVLREVSPEDEVQKILNSVNGCDQDVNATCEGRMLRKDDELRSCGVSDGCTMQVTSRMRGGGRHKVKKSEEEKKQVTSQEQVSNEGPAILEGEKDPVIWMLEETEEYRTIVAYVSDGSDVDVERKMRYWVSKLQERPGGDIMECGLRWAVEARRKGRGAEEEQKQRRQEEGQEEGEQVRFGEEERLEETTAESTDEPEVAVGWQRYGQTEEIQASSEGETRDVGRTSPAEMAKERVKAERASMEAKEELEAKEHSRSRT